MIVYVCSSLNDAGLVPGNGATVSEITNQERHGKNAMYSALRHEMDRNVMEDVPTRWLGGCELCSLALMILKINLLIDA
jgi:hypothetical protein